MRGLSPPSKRGMMFVCGDCDLPRRIARKQFGGPGLSDIVWLLSMFRLPTPLRGKYRWFAVLYYGSIVAFIVVPWVALVWKFAGMA
jgi:hypothetical protein